MSLTNQLRELGYGLARNRADAWGKRWAYQSYPIASGGPVNYFRNAGDVRRYVAQVRQVREWQREAIENAA